MSDLQWHIDGIPCQIEVTSYSPGAPMVITGWGFGDAEPEEPEEIEWVVLDRRGRRAEWLERKMIDDDQRDIDRQLSEQAARNRRGDD